MEVTEILGESRPVALPTKSAIYVWGYNQRGQTGRNEKGQKLRIPRQLPPELFGCPTGNNTRWLDVACGREHTAAVASDGSLFTWGSNLFLKKSCVTSKFFLRFKFWLTLSKFRGGLLITICSLWLKLSFVI